MEGERRMQGFVCVWVGSVVVYSGACIEGTLVAERST